MEVSARNILKGKVKEIKIGQVMAEVVIEIPGGREIVSVITAGSAKRLGLTIGKEVNAMIKATSVMVNV